MEEDTDWKDVVPGQVFVAGAGKFPSDLDLVVTEGDGCYVRTASGEEYLDYLLGGGPLIAGHNHPHIVDAIRDQAENCLASFLSSERSLTLAERVADAVPNAEAVRFHSTGSQATYFAMRLARAYTGNEKVLKFSGAYHGWHDYALVTSSYADSNELYEQVSAGAHPETTTDSAGMVAGATESVLSAPYNDLERTREIVAAHADELAAVIVEPVMRSLPPAEGFLEGLREICDEHDFVLVFDEVVTGFRMSLGGAQEYFGVEPDLATFGKAIGGGVPLSATTGVEEIMRLADPAVPKSEGGAYLSGTLSGNPLCAAAGHATLDVLEKPGTYSSLNDYAERFRTLIDDMLADSRLSGQAMGEGPIVDYLITDADEVTDWQTFMESDSKTKKEIDRELLEEGIIQLHGSKRYISTEHGDRELERTAEAFKAAVERVH